MPALLRHDAPTVKLTDALDSIFFELGEDISKDDGAVLERG